MIVSEAIEMSLENEKHEPDIVLAWAIRTTNALQNHLGLSPNELVFGFNINIPSVLTDQLSTLEAATTHVMVRTNLNVLQCSEEKLHRS